MRKIGTYELLGTLARGGMAELHLARARGLHGFEKTVVLKRIHPHLAGDPAFVDMFLDEARLAAQLDHPNVVQVFDIGEGEDGVFFVMEYLDGMDVGTLAERVGGPLPLEHAVAIVAAAAAGLHHAHRRVGSDGRPLAVIHRDVSPSNIFVTVEGAVKVVDFGIAKAATNRRDTQQSQLKGKIRYMSPEQCKAAALDARSDIFSLGSVLHRIATGRAPFVGESEFAVMNQIVNGRVVPPAESVPQFPPELSRIIVKSMEPSADDRYETAEAMRRDLESFARSQGYSLSTGALADFLRALDVPGETTVPIENIDAKEQTPAVDETTAVSFVPVAATAPAPASRLLPMVALSAVVAAAVAGLGIYALDRTSRSAPEAAPRETITVQKEQDPSPEPAPVEPEATAEPSQPAPEARVAEVEPPVEVEPDPEPPKPRRRAKKPRRRPAPAPTTSKPDPVSGDEWVPVRREP